jgi:uncharacterized Zn-binding protein involved in type VI secretion
MGLPAARKTDNTSHWFGSEITVPCAANTEIEGLPAARITDTNHCKWLLHDPNKICSGSETVLIEGRWASRKTDESLCSATITMGAANVEIGGPTLKFKARNNTMVAISDETKTMYILSWLEFSGPDASADYAARAEAQIENMWSGTTTIDGETYNVEVDVTSRYGDGTPTDGYDQIIVDDTYGRSNQALYGEGDGHQSSTDADAESYVAAHEYGHSLGIVDEYHDEPGKGSVPNDPSKTNNIMAETWVGSDGVHPHPYPDHYETILENYGVR